MENIKVFDKRGKVYDVLYVGKKIYYIDQDGKEVDLKEKDIECVRINNKDFYEDER